MLKRIPYLLLEFIAGLTGNLIAAWIQQDVWSNFFTIARIIGTFLGALIMIFLIAWLENKQNSSDKAIQNIEKEERQFDDNRSYRVNLGLRHKNLRENYLKINPRKMADFYGFKKVSQLEKYESGKDEFPQEKLDKLIEFFFVNRGYLDEGQPYIFNEFFLYSSQPGNLLDNGFRPYFLCNPEDRENLFTYPVMFKVEDDLGRVIRGDLLSSFASRGGGKRNIVKIIEAMIKRNMDWTVANVFLVSPEIWKELQNLTFYTQDIYSIADCPDRACEDVFIQWYEETQ
jgi:hypothetical protein